MINNVTTNFSWPRPNQANYLSDDVGRLDSALQAIDAAVKTLADNFANYLTTSAAGAFQTTAGMSAYLTTVAAAAAYQAKLNSGTNIKTINGASLLGSGDLAVSGGIAWVKKTAAYTSADKDGVLADTSGGAWTLKLPASPTVGMQVYVADPADWSVNNLTVDPQAGNTIASQAASATLVLDLKGALVTFVHDGTKWDVFAQTVGLLSGGGGSAPALNIAAGVSVSMAANNHYVLTNVAATTATLPASPTAGDIVWVTVANGLATNTIARNGNKIMSLAEDMTMDSTYAAARLRYADATRGWVVV